jgi:peroxiredoxin
MAAPSEQTQAPHFEAKPIFGKALSIREHSQNKGLVLVFLPSLGSPVARSCVSALQQRVAEFELADVGLYALTRSAAVAAQDFVPRYHLLFPLIADPEGRFFSLYGLGSLGPKQALSSLRPKRLRAGLQGFRHGIGRPEKGLFCSPAAFAIGRGGQITMAHVGYSLWEPLPLETLLLRAGS